MPFATRFGKQQLITIPNSRIIGFAILAVIGERLASKDLNIIVYLPQSLNNLIYKRIAAALQPSQAWLERLLSVLPIGKCRSNGWQRARDRVVQIVRIVSRCAELMFDSRADSKERFRQHP